MSRECMAELRHEELPGGRSACYLDEGHEGAHLEFYGWEWIEPRPEIVRFGWRAGDFEELRP